MKRTALSLLLILSSISSFGQLRRIYFNPELGYQPHFQAACVMHFKYAISLNAGLNYEIIPTGYSKLHNAVFGKKFSNINNDFVGIHVLPGFSSNFERKFDIAIYGGLVYGTYMKKTNFKYVNKGSDGHTYTYDSERVFKAGVMGRIDFSFQFHRYVGLNLALGAMSADGLTSVYGTVGVMVGRVRNKIDNNYSPPPNL